MTKLKKSLITKDSMLDQLRNLGFLGGTVPDDQCQKKKSLTGGWAVPVELYGN